MCDFKNSLEFHLIIAIEKEHYFFLLREVKNIMGIKIPKRLFCSISVIHHAITQESSLFSFAIHCFIMGQVMIELMNISFFFPKTIVRLCPEMCTHSTQSCVLLLLPFAILCN